MRIAFLNPQGNFDKYDSRWASHPDFGGQLVYVKEIAIELAFMGHKVDIFTRQIIDKNWPEFSEPFDEYEGMKNLRIIRIKCGPDRFLEKEKLWPYICPEYAEKIIRFYRDEGRMPDALTSHYGDGGLAAAYIKKKTGIPYTFTAHSLGAQKMDKLRINKFNIRKFNDRYNFTARLLAERISINNSDMIITSTKSERFSQYTHIAYQEAVVIDNDERFSVIPPGVSLRVFDRKNIIRDPKKLYAMIAGKIKRDIYPSRINLPVVISASRLDPKKNIAAMIRAFAHSDMLKDKANLVIVTRGYDNPMKEHDKIPQSKEKDVLMELISLIDRYNLQGKVSMFSIDNQTDLAGMYRYFSSRNSVFCLAALYEPFGLAPLEAMACGLPVVVTKFGGPAESLIDKDQTYGQLVDPTDPEEIAAALYRLVSSQKYWKECSDKGYKRVLDQYTWRKTAESYLGVIRRIRKSSSRHSIFDIDIDEYFIDPARGKKLRLETLKRLYYYYDLLCVGCAVVDFISLNKTNSLRDADTFRRHLGGNPAYVSVYTSKLSKKTVLLTKLGRGQFGTFLERELQRSGVSTEYLSYTNSEDTSVSFLSHTPTVPDFQSMYSADKKLDIKDVPEEVIERAKIVHTSLSSMSHEPSRSAVRKALRIAKNTRKMVSLDPNYHPRTWPDKDEALEILAQVSEDASVVFPSINDARHLFDYNMEESKLIRLTIKTFHDWGAKMVVVTDRGKKIIYSDRRTMKKIDDFKRFNIVDVSGADAAFISGFLVAYMEKLSPEKCVRFGFEVSKLALQSVGPFPKSIFRKDILSRI